MEDILKKVKQGLHFPINYIVGRTRPTNKSVNNLKPKEGAIIEIKGNKIAVYKENSNETILLSSVCTHMGCIVAWNTKDVTWDCPCHGSRFTKEGAVVVGPAKHNLVKIKV